MATKKRKKLKMVICLKKEDFRDSEVSRKKERDPKNDKKGDQGKDSEVGFKQTVVLEANN